MDENEIMELARAAIRSEIEEIQNGTHVQVAAFWIRRHGFRVNYSDREEMVSELIEPLRRRLNELDQENT